MAKTLDETVGGIFCCQIPRVDPWCNDCPYERVKNCREELQNDISYWASKKKLVVGSEGTYCLKIDDIPQQKSKRKNGRRYSDGERRNNRQYGGE